MNRLFVEASRRSRDACLAFGFATAFTLGFSASAGADDIACHGSEKRAVKAAVATPAGIAVPRVAPTPAELERLLATVRVELAPSACPAIDDPASGAGLRAFVDPATGLLREPTAGDWAALRSASEPSRFEKRSVAAAATAVYALPGGGVAEVAGPEAMTEFSIEVGPDGTRTVHCTQSGYPPAAPVREKAKE